MPKAPDFAGKDAGRDLATGDCRNPDLKERLERELKATTGLSIDAELVAPGDLARAAGRGTNQGETGVGSQGVTLVFNDTRAFNDKLGSTGDLVPVTEMVDWNLRSAVLQRWAEHGEKLAVTGICGCSIVSIPMAKMEIPGQCQLFDSRVVK